MGKFTLLAQEEDGRDWGLGHFTGNQVVGKLEGRKRAEGHVWAKSCKVGVLMQEESFSEVPTKSPSLRSLWDRKKGPGLGLQ